MNGRQPKTPRGRGRCRFRRPLGRPNPGRIRPVDILVLDRNNYHTFLALLYQVAAAELEAEDIAYPVRSIFGKLPAVDFALAHVRPHRCRKTVCGNG